MKNELNMVKPYFIWKIEREWQTQFLMEGGGCVKTKIP